MFGLIAHDPDTNQQAVLLEAKSIDLIIEQFIKESKKISKNNPRSLLTKTQFYIVSDTQKHMGTMIWAEAGGTGEVILTVHRHDRNVLFIYNYEGRLVGRNIIQDLNDEQKDRLGDYLE